MPGFMTLQAYCEQCDQTREVYADELFEFDCRCEACNSLLVLQEDDAPPPLPGVSEQPTKSDSIMEDDDLEDLIAEAANRPTTADTDDPYALAAQALDSSIGFLNHTDPEPSPSTGALSALGTLPDEPPLPSWDGGDTQQVRELATGQPPATRQPSLEETGLGIPGEVVPPSNAPLPELDELVEVVHLPGGATMGRGSRTYDKDQVLPEGDEPTFVDDVDEVEAYLREPSTQLEQSTAAPPAEPVGGGANGSSHTDSKLFPRDLDWLALMDDALPDREARSEPEEGKARVYIRMPEELAPQSDDDIEALKQTMATLETNGAAGLEAMLLGGSAREAKRYVVEDTQLKSTTDQATQPFQRGEELKGHGELSMPRVDDETRSYKSAEEGTQEGEGEDGRTQAWSKPQPGTTTPKKSSRPAAPLRPASSRNIARPTPRKIVEEFRRAELDAGLVCARDVNSLDADYFRQLYQQIFHARNGSSPRVVLVTSARAKEGKTTIAANLAIVAARIPGRGGVLVDADPRGRGVLRAFGQRATAEGLLESLQTSKDPAEYVMQFSLGALDVVPLGVPSSDAAELIASDRMGAALDSLRGTYADSTIIVDGSAVLHSADPLVLARLVDGVVLVVRAGVTPRHEVQRVLDLLGPDRVLGVVLNDADEE